MNLKTTKRKCNTSSYLRTFKHFRFSNNDKNINTFVQRVNSSAVTVNASTRFNDGGEIGLGSEIAISTTKVSPRGPLGLEEITTYKWLIRGKGHIRD